MDFNLKEVMNLLNVREATIHQWIKDGKLPAYQRQGEYFFSKEEIDNCLMSHKLDEDIRDFHSNEQECSGNLQFALYRAIHRGDVLRDIEGSSKKEVIQQATQVIAQKLDLDSDTLFNMLIEREELMSTALGSGVAVPHTRDFLLNDHYDAVFVVYPKEPLDYEALDQEKVQVMFFLLACEDKRHLHLLSKIAHLSLDAQSLAFLNLLPDKRALLSYVRDWEGQLKSGKANSNSLPI